MFREGGMESGVITFEDRGKPALSLLNFVPVEGSPEQTASFSLLGTRYVCVCL